MIVNESSVTFRKNSIVPHYIMSFDRQVGEKLGATFIIIERNPASLATCWILFEVTFFDNFQHQTGGGVVKPNIGYKNYGY